LWDNISKQCIYTQYIDSLYGEVDKLMHCESDDVANFSPFPAGRNTYSNPLNGVDVTASMK